VTEQAFVKTTRIPTSDAGDVPVYLIGNLPYSSTGAESVSHPGYFQEATESKKIYTLAPEPYVFFCRAALEMLKRLKPRWRPDILHCNDWHTGLLPVYAREFYQDVPVIADTASVFTIHNLAYQGNFRNEKWTATGLPESLRSVDGLEFYGEWTFLKGAMMFADQINTVSENYAREIQTVEYGSGLQGLMQTLHTRGALSGIINGIDYEVYNPATDPRIPCHFSADSPIGKAQCKAALQAESGLPQISDIPVIGLISRLADQKGLDLIHQISESLLRQPVQFVLLGTGDPAYERYFTQLQTRFPAQVHARIGFDVDLAQRIYAGSDLFLMPSRFEPCGLGQMFALRYGTIPIVRATGGLADSVHDFDPERAPKGNGFVFTEYTSDALMTAVCRALSIYQEKKVWSGLVRRALQSDFSWTRSAERYTALYHRAQTTRRTGDSPLINRA
jgi:starch synthase